ncbi:MAG: IclR family transcriptional regulator [Alphaproteobacteria bacterium]|nr:IclR family transcriptional regulator [Alphaproteobacteria bacterium]
MSVVTKALNLLQYFSTSRPEIGLSEFRRLAGHDKATTYRYLQALEKAGFIEKIPTNRSYRIGPAVLHLAQMRELTVPRREGAQAALKALAEATGETAHISVLSGTDLHSLSSCESDKHSTRAIIDVNILPLHATASGICALAFGPADLTGFALNSLVEFTDKTAVTEEALMAEIERCRDCGFGQSDRGFEDDICGISAPLFDQTGAFAGSVAVASVASRLTGDAERTIKAQLMAASRDVTRNWGGTIPDGIERVWANARTES